MELVDLVEPAPLDNHATEELAFAIEVVMGWSAALMLVVLFAENVCQDKHAKTDSVLETVNHNVFVLTEV